jgi:imidazolonepropionase-like amidohydrolase
MELMAKQGIFLVPTLTVYVYHRRSALRHVRERAYDLEPHHRSSLQQALSIGVPIAAGTDAGMHGHPSNAVELAHLVEAGMTPSQALIAATSAGARCLGIDGELGTIKKGKIADLLVVSGDPLADIALLQNPDNIRLVMKDGEIVVQRYT